MKNFKKVLVSFVVLLLAVGCSSGNDGNNNTEILTEITEPVTITFWHAMNGSQEEALTYLVDQFMKDNPNITVELQNQSSYKELSEKLTNTYITPDNLPNLTQAYPGFVYNAAGDGLLEEIRPYIDNDKIGIADYDTDIIEGFKKDGIIEGKEYGIPFNKSTEVVYVNKTLLNELELTLPTNLEDFKNVAEAIYNETGMVGAGFDSLNNYYIQFLFSEGVEFNSELDPAGDASRKAIEYYLEGIQEGYFRIAGSDGYLSGPFSSELLAMNVGSIAGEKYVTKGVDGKFEVVAIHSPFETAIQQGTDVYMFSNGTAEQKTASYLLMKYLIGADSTLYFALNTGYLPVRKSVIESEAYTNTDSLIAPIAKEITAKLMGAPKDARGNAAYQDVSSQLEIIFSNPDGNLDDQLKAFSASFKAAYSD